MNMTDTIKSRVVADTDRVKVTSKLFGLNFPMRLEPFVFDVAGRLAPKYKGGFWLFYELSNGGFYMGLRPDRVFPVSSQNGFEGQMSGDALGVTACLFGYSNLSFGGDAFAPTCAEHYHRLRDFAMEHREARAILRAID